MNLKTMGLDLEKFVFITAVMINYFGLVTMAVKWQGHVYMQKFLLIIFRNSKEINTLYKKLSKYLFYSEYNM